MDLILRVSEVASLPSINTTLVRPVFEHLKHTTFKAGAPFWSTRGRGSALVFKGKFLCLRRGSSRITNSERWSCISNTTFSRCSICCPSESVTSPTTIVLGSLSDERSRIAQLVPTSQRCNNLKSTCQSNPSRNIESVCFAGPNSLAKYHLALD